jgi:biotin operon repressor
LSSNYQPPFVFHPGSCADCWDSTIAITPKGIERCCLDKGSSTPAAEKLSEHVLLRVEKKMEIDPRVLNTARAIITATVEQPISGHTLQAILRESRRSVSAFVEELRSEWVLPIGSTRHLGYYWMHTEKDFIDWSRPYRGQAITSLATVYRMQRKNFPNLAGQGSLEFVEQVKSEMEEAIK